MTLRRHNHYRPSAFTLIEVLIATAIFSIVLAAMTTVFYSALRLRNNATAALEAALPTENALTIIKRDLANIVPTSGPLSGALQSTVSTNNIPGRIGPDFYTSTGLLNDTSPAGDIQRVTYALVESTNSLLGKDLVRAVTRNLLSLNQEPPTQQWLLSDVQSLVFLYHDGLQWQTSWDSAVQTNLPYAIKVQIQLASDKVTGSTQNTPLELVIPLDASGSTNQTQQEAVGGTP